MVKNAEKAFVDLYSHPITCARPQKYAEKTFTDGRKSTKFVIVFSLESVPLYGTCTCVHRVMSHRDCIMWYVYMYVCVKFLVSLIRAAATLYVHALYLL